MMTKQNGPTERQLAFINELLVRLHGPDNAPEDQLIFDQEVLPHLDKSGASEYISGLLEAIAQASHTPDTEGSQGAGKPRKPKGRDDVPAGRYAVVVEDDVRFFQVDRPTEGKWSGWTFVNRIHANGLRINAVKGTDAEAILDQIAADPLAASAEYGKHTGVCGMCMRMLTNPESVARGIGPICAGRL